MLRGVASLVAFLLLPLAGCTSDEPSPPSGPASTAPAPSDEDRWIDVDGAGFVDTRTGEAFVPRGVNLLRKLGGGGGDQLFGAGYDLDWLDEQLEQISALGFNTVRFFLDMCMECTSTADGLRADYLDALAEVLTRIEAHGLTALPTSNDVPDPGFSDRLPCCEPFGGYRNSLYLSAEGHAIAAEYWTRLIEGVRERGAPTHHVLGWELVNEQFVLRDVAPISLTTGTVTTADGATYDLADDDAVAEMVVENVRAYIQTVGDAIRSVDDGALVTIGYFSAEDPRAGRTAGDARWVVPRQIMRDGAVDFFDLHAYPGLGGTWDGIAPAFGLAGFRPSYPVLLGEFGAFEDAYPDSDEAAAAMARWQAESCDVGFGGWLLWFWGSDRDDEVVTAEAHDAAVARAVAPSVRPDPCDAADFESPNLALGRPVTASAEESPEYAASNLTDGSDATWWSAGEGPPQSFEVDLEEERTVAVVEILVGEVSAPGPQTHRVTLVDADGTETPAGEVSVDAAHGDWLRFEVAPTDGVRRVRVETLAVDGWVILHEIRVLAP